MHLSEDRRTPSSLVALTGIIELVLDTFTSNLHTAGYELELEPMPGHLVKLYSSDDIGQHNDSVGVPGKMPFSSFERSDKRHDTSTISTLGFWVAPSKMLYLLTKVPGLTQACVDALEEMGYRSAACFYHVIISRSGCIPNENVNEIDNNR